MEDQEQFDAAVEELDLDHYDEDALEAYWEHHGNLDDFEDTYRGHFYGGTEDAAIGDYCEETEMECGTLGDVPDRFQYYIDWESMGRDCRLGGDLYTIEADGGGYYIFSN